MYEPRFLDFIKFKETGEGTFGDSEDDSNPHIKTLSFESENEPLAWASQFAMNQNVTHKIGHST